MEDGVLLLFWNKSGLSVCLGDVKEKHDLFCVNVGRKGGEKETLTVGGAPPFF